MPLGSTGALRKTPNTIRISLKSRAQAILRSWHPTTAWAFRQWMPETNQNIPSKDMVYIAKIFSEFGFSEDMNCFTPVPVCQVLSLQRQIHCNAGLVLCSRSVADIKKQFSLDVSSPTHLFCGTEAICF